MNANSKGRSSSTASRISRGIGAAALSTVLIVGLAGCMTGRAPTISGPVVVNRNAEVPAGVDLWQPADRIAEQLAHQAAVDTANAERFAGVPADRVAEQLARETLGGGSTVVVQQSVTTAQHFPTWTDRITAQIEYRAAHPYAGMTADHIERFLLQAR
ncbi:hypothetical protein SAMN04487846_2202 [Microbacterium sp. cf046]|uniref:hypothetical protein n=1 Tax=Microbacterium sp. cf046 TaxID=1761803 RepID=UPI0008E81E69|nr:hypothetical protein [Microbacterium sp. cf046]SFS07188.1 hypothetical protein SAMN04487846_2202 [Microbacterium sp. cf046]